MATTGRATDFRTVDLNNLIIPPLTKKEKGNTSTTPLYNNGDGTNSMLCIQTPTCRFPFGLSKQTSDKDGSISWSLNGSFDKYREDPLMGDFYKFFVNLEDYMVALAAANSQAWFGTTYDPSVCRVLMNRAIKTSKDKEKADKYDPTFKATVRTKKDGDFWATAKGVNGDPINLTDITPGCKGTMKIKLSSIYVVNKTFGFTFDLEWVRIKELSSSGRVDDYNPNMYGTETPAPAIPAAIDQEPDLYANVTTSSNVPSGSIPKIAIPSLNDAIGGGGANKKRERQDEEQDSSSSATKPGTIKRAKAPPV